MKALAVYSACVTALLVAVAAWHALGGSSHAAPPPAAPPIPLPTPIQGRAPQLHGEVVFLGDSRVALLATSEVVSRSENLGMSGQTLSALADQLRGVDLSGASAIVVEGGVDDWYVARRKADIPARYAAVLARLPARVPVVAAAVLPVNEHQVGAYYHNALNWNGVDSKVPAWNRAIRALCDARPRCTFAPVPQALVSGDGLDAADSIDGIHLNAAGSAIWAAGLRHALSGSGG